VTGDYKYEMQLIAEQIAEDEYGKDFYELSQDLQYQVFTRAEREYVERACDRADYLRKAERER
jgi:hypothetical protein